jgi:membrane protein YqaA with SNARE-associated domain
LGQPALLSSWLPGVGNAFTVAVDVMRIPLPLFLLLVAIAKGVRYAAALGAGQGFDIKGRL